MKYPMVVIITIYVLMVTCLSLKIGFKESADYAWPMMIAACGFYWLISKIIKSATN